MLDIIQSVCEKTEHKLHIVGTETHPDKFVIIKRCCYCNKVIRKSLGSLLQSEISDIKIFITKARTLNISPNAIVYENTTLYKLAKIFDMEYE